MKNTIIEVFKEVINEAVKINFSGHKFVLNIDVNEDPKKKGIKIQFIPMQAGIMSPTKRNDISIELQKRLEKGLRKYDLSVERDRNLKDDAIIGFFIYLEYFDNIIRRALSDQNPKTEDPSPKETPADDATDFSNDV